jgi:rare lipoprotein A
MIIRRWWIICLLIGLSLPTVVMASSQKHSTKGAKNSKKSVKQSRIKTKPHSEDYMDGVASCYASKFIGRRTTSGDVFAMDRYTGAHIILPMRTKLKVTNLSNVEVNDRMARRSGHVIDLSSLSASKIGLKCPSLARNVHLDVLDNDTYNNLMQGQLGNALIAANPFLSESQTLELANQFAAKMAEESSSKEVVESKDSGN